jgi:hypothetical protein
VALLLGLLACSSSSSDPNPPGGNGAFLRVYNTAKAAGTLTIRVDGVTVRSNLAYGAATDSVEVSPGSHTVALVPSAAGHSTGSGMVVAREGRLAMLLAVESLTVFIPQPLDDSGAVVPAGKSRLRVAHLAALAPDIAISRIQPDFPDPVSVMFPFNYSAVSPYILSDAGNWWVIVTDSTPGDTLIKQGPIAIPSGELRTVVIMDADSGALQALILDP